MSIVKSGMHQHDLHRLSHAAFPLSFFILILLSDPEFLPEKLVISMFKQEFQMSVKPARVLLEDARRFMKYRAPSVRSSPESALSTASTVSAVTLQRLIDPFPTGENWCFW